MACVGTKVAARYPARAVNDQKSIDVAAAERPTSQLLRPTWRKQRCCVFKYGELTDGNRRIFSNNYLARNEGGFTVRTQFIPAITVRIWTHIFTSHVRDAGQIKGETAMQLIECVANYPLLMYVIDWNCFRLWNAIICNFWWVSFHLPKSILY